MLTGFLAKVTECLVVPPAEASRPELNGKEEGQDSLLKGTNAFPLLWVLPSGRRQQLHPDIPSLSLPLTRLSQEA